MKKLIITCIIIMSFSLAWAADEALVVPHVFEKGAVAKADQMNEMFEAIQYIMNKNLVVMYDYGTPTNTTKTFEHTGSPTTLVSIITEPGMETWTYLDGSSVEYLTADSPEGTMEIGRNEYDTSGILIKDLTYDPPLLGVDLAGPKEVGKIWGGGYIATKSVGGIDSETNTKMFSILAIEDVTVPAGTFTGCIKVHCTTSNYKWVAWYAEGVGMVKRIGWLGPMTSEHGLMELQSIE